MSDIGRNVDTGNSAAIAVAARSRCAQFIENDRFHGPAARRRQAIPDRGEALDLTTADIAQEFCLRCRLDSVET
jgi:hypothetical protein